MPHSTQRFGVLVSDETSSDRSSKMRRTLDHDDGTSHQSHDTEFATNTTLLTHAPPQPLGIKPLGNYYDTNELNIKSRYGAFAGLPDEIIVQILETLESLDLVKLGSTCKALYAHCRADEFWRALFIESPPTLFKWNGSWRSTLLGLDPSHESNIQCDGLYSDVLYRPFFCAHIPLAPFTSRIPARNQIARLTDLSPEDFESSWANEPFILTAPVKEWPVYQRWSNSYLAERFGATKFRAEAVDWPLTTYVEYMQHNSDESPLYLFDCRFAEKMNLEVRRGGDYWPPSCFGEDLFSVLDEQRPDSRWLIVGPARSGSTFHKDPNATSAWNAVLQGSKYWIMFPSSSTLPPPPGVYVSEDQSEVTSPLSIAEWLLGFHEEARKTPLCKEGICKGGEVLHVPSGWYHLVLNLEPSIAITQNFIPKAHLPAALTFMRDKTDQISGFSKDVVNPTQLFEERMRAIHPALFEQAQAKLAGPQHSVKKNTWGTVVGAHEQNGDGFKFGFADEGETI